MSRVARTVVSLEKAILKDKGNFFEVSGEHGSLNVLKCPGISYIIDDGSVSAGKSVRVDMDKVVNPAMAGTAIRLLQSAILGVQNLWVKVVEIHGKGTKATIVADEISLNVGYSHSVKIKIPNNIKASLKDNSANFLELKSADKKSLGDFIADIKKVRKSRVYGDFYIHVQGDFLKIKKRGING